MILFVCDVERFSCRMIIHDLPSRRITCSDILASYITILNVLEMSQKQQLNY